MIKYFIVGLIGIVVLGSCSKPDCTNVLPPPDYFLLHIQDTAGNDLIGTTYTKDAYELTGNGVQTMVSPEPFGPQYMLRIMPKELENETNYYLKLSDTDTDTISIFYVLEEQECFTTFKLFWVKYNGENFGDDQPVVVIKKV